MFHVSCNVKQLAGIHYVSSGINDYLIGSFEGNRVFFTQCQSTESTVLRIFGGTLKCQFSGMIS